MAEGEVKTLQIEVSSRFSYNFLPNLFTLLDIPSTGLPQMRATVTQAFRGIQWEVCQELEARDHNTVRRDGLVSLPAFESQWYYGKYCHLCIPCHGTGHMGHQASIDLTPSSLGLPLRHERSLTSSNPWSIHMLIRSQRLISLFYSFLYPISVCFVMARQLP